MEISMSVHPMCDVFQQPRRCLCLHRHTAVVSTYAVSFPPSFYDWSVTHFGWCDLCVLRITNAMSTGNRHYFSFPLLLIRDADNDEGLTIYKRFQRIAENILLFHDRSFRSPFKAMRIEKN